MNVEEFGKARLAAHYPVHKHQGVWWERRAFRYQTTAVRLQDVVPGEAKPGSYFSLLAYAHKVEDPRRANAHWSLMVLSPESLRDFSVPTLAAKKRSQVRKGLRDTRIERIQLGDAKEQMIAVAASNAARNRHGLNASFYRDHAELWWRSILRDSHAMDFWGAFFDSTMTAYIACSPVENCLYINALKSHTDFLDKCPNDALIFSVVCHYRDTTGCHTAVFGDWVSDKPTLNQYKASFGFQRKQIPVFRWINPLFRPIVNRIVPSS